MTNDTSALKYFKIRLASMHPHRPITFDIYILLNLKYILYMRAGAKFEGEKLENFLYSLFLR